MLRLNNNVITSTWTTTPNPKGSHPRWTSTSTNPSQQLSAFNSSATSTTCVSSAPHSSSHLLPHTNHLSIQTGHCLPPRTSLQRPSLPRLPTTLHLRRPKPQPNRIRAAKTTSPRPRRRNSALHPNPIYLPLHPRPRRQATAPPNLRHGRSRHHQPPQLLFQPQRQQPRRRKQHRRRTKRLKQIRWLRGRCCTQEPRRTHTTNQDRDAQRSEVGAARGGTTGPRWRGEIWEFGCGEDEYGD